MKRSNTLTFDIGKLPKTPEDQMARFDAVLRESLKNRMEALRDEAQTIGNDMEALVGRLEDEGHEAQLEDIRSARWYRTAAQLSALKKLYSAWCEITGLECEPVRMEGAPEECDLPVPVNDCLSGPSVDES